jgi:hypothetical protein
MIAEWASIRTKAKLAIETPSGIWSKRVGVQLRFLMTALDIPEAMRLKEFAVKYCLTNGVLYTCFRRILVLIGVNRKAQIP